MSRTTGRTAVAMLLVLGAARLAAQAAPDPQCAVGSNPLDPNRLAGDACQKAIDLYQYMAPQLGISMTGGNAILGQGGTVGGLGHFRVDARFNGLLGSVPDVQAGGAQPQASGPRASDYTTRRLPLGLPAAAAEIGLFQGLSLGLTHLGGVDVLVTGTVVPSVSANGVGVTTTGGAFKVGYGARLGVLEESLLVPGVSLTYLRRDLPRTNITAVTGGTTLRVRDLDEQTQAWRVVVSKSLLLFSLAAGVGRDTYRSRAEAGATYNFGFGTASRDGVVIAQRLSRTNAFVDASLNLFLLKLVGELGMVRGGSVPTYNQFDKPADDPRVFGSVGLRFGF